jgi:hypothetical protein
MTILLTEIKRLAAASQLVPKSYSYSSGKSDAKMGTNTLGITFAVQGPYRNVRQLINMLELSKQFVTIDSIALTSSGLADSLNLSLQLETLFKGTADASETPEGSAL